MKVLIVGPSPEKSKGGMATVIKEIKDDNNLNTKFDIDIFDSYIDGGKFKVAIYSVYMFIKFLIFKRQYDIYHIHVASKGSTFRKRYYVRAIKRWKKKVILHIHGARYVEFFNSLSTRKQRQVVGTLKSSDIVIALSKDWKKIFDEMFGLNNCVAIENGINVNSLSNAITPACDYMKSFIMLGRLGDRKGTYDLIKAVERAKEKVPDIKCYLAGDGEIEKYQKIIIEKRLEKNIIIVGWINYEKKISLLKKCSTVVLPSYNEGLPMAILEGMACGKAIISTKVGAIPEVVMPDNGILIPPGDINKLTEALITCATDKRLMNVMHKSNILKVKKNFSMEIMHKKLEYYYNSLLGEDRG